MPTKHVAQYIEAYLDEQLSTEERQLVEEHLAACPSCARYFFDAQRLKTSLGPVIQTALGRPMPPPTLRRRVRQALNEEQASRQVTFPWAIPGRVLNTLGTLAVSALLAFAVFGVIQGQLPGAEEVLPEISSLRPSNDGGGQISIPTSTATPMESDITATPRLKLSSLGETLPKPTPSPTNVTGDSLSLATPLPPAEGRIATKDLLQQELIREDNSHQQITEPKLPGGTMAFAFFNPAAHRQVYEIHLISPDSTDHRLFPLDGVSEPALRWTDEGHQIAYRAWSEPTSPRSLLNSNLEGYRPRLIGGFWEDAQPDWSPTENRIIFASQRESDRRWRLYTIWGDGSAEKDLRREGQSPSFAPDGYRFVFVGCDHAGNQCGLWLGDLDNSEYGSRLFLADPLAKSPDWSPVDEQIVYMANPHGNWDLYLVNSDGNNVRRLTTNPAIDGLPTWSPDGKWLAFLSDRGKNWGIWLLHVASGQVHQVFSFDGGTFVPPNRSPYGERNWWDEQLSWGR